MKTHFTLLFTIILGLAGCQSDESEEIIGERANNMLTNGYVLDFDTNPFAFQLPSADKAAILQAAADSIVPILVDSIDAKIPFGSPRWIERANPLIESRYGIPNKKKLEGSNLDHRSVANVEYNTLQLINYILLQRLQGTEHYDLLQQETVLVDSLISAQNAFLQYHFQYQCVEPDSNSWRMYHYHQMEWQSLLLSVLMAVNSPQELATFPKATDKQIESEYERLNNSLSEITDSCYNLQANREALDLAHAAWDNLDRHHNQLSQVLPDSVFNGMVNMLRFKQYVRLKNSFKEYSSQNYELGNKRIKEDALLK